MLLIEELKSRLINSIDLSKNISDEELDELLEMLDDNGTPYCADEGLLMITME